MARQTRWIGPGNMHSKLLIAHLLVFIVSIFICTQAYDYFEQESTEFVYAVFHFILVVLLYAFSGFVSTNREKHFQLANYCGIAFIGFIIWLLALLTSPDNLNWKVDNGGLLWLLYRIYISGVESPFSFNAHFSFWTASKNINIGLLLLLSLLPSILQAIGGYLKMKWPQKSY